MASRSEMGCSRCRAVLIPQGKSEILHVRNGGIHWKGVIRGLAVAHVVIRVGGGGAMAIPPCVSKSFLRVLEIGTCNYASSGSFPARRLSG
jgi:hypothetical protein